MQNELSIDIGAVIEKKMGRKLPRPLSYLLERLIHQREINYVLATYGHLDGVAFMSALISHFALNISWVGEEKLPNNQRCLFVSNHPLGALDGICLSHMLAEHYSTDIKYIVNDLLYFLKPLQSIFVPVNKFGAQKRERINMLQDALESSVPVVSFPAGICSRRINGKIQDLPWQKSFVAQAITYQRDVVPLYFEGRNSYSFYIIEQLRKAMGVKFNIGTALLPHEMFSSKGKSFRVMVGEPISWQTLANDKVKPIEIAQKIRNITYQIPLLYR